MTWKEDFTRIYFDEKGKYRNATRNGIIILCMALGLIIFSTFIPSKALILPATVMCIAVLVTLYKNRKTKKDDKIWLDDNLKRVDDPDKFT